MKTKSIKMIVASALLFLMAPAMGFAQDATTSGGFDWTIVWTILISVLFLGLSLAMIGHMVYVKFIRKPFADDYTPETFKQMRQEGGEFVSEAEANEKASELLLDAYNAWTEIDTQDGGSIKIPYCRKDVVRSYAAAEEIIKLAPTDPELIDAFNDFTHDLNESMKRSFDGSKMFIIVSLIIGLVMSLLSGAWPFMGMIAVSSVIYWLSSQTPLWMEVRKEVKGKGGKPSFMTRLFGGLLGAAATATTYKVVTEYSDGSTEERTDNSNFWLGLIFAIIVMFIMAVFMFFVAAINYLRNYIIYR